MTSWLTDRVLSWPRPRVIALSVIVSVVGSVVLTLAGLLAVNTPPAWIAYGLGMTVVIAAVISFTVTRVVVALLHQVKEARERAETMARTDSLTGVLNRRSFVEGAARVLAADAAKGDPVSLILLDVDDFKVINDAHGHDVGDDVLTQVARRCGAAVRDGDLVARWGGEEFVVLLPGASREVAAGIAERILSSITQVGVPAGGRVTASVGTATAEGGPRGGLQGLVSRADQAMYRAKRAGKNAVHSLDA